ncbi:hypothetical protein HK414_24565 [Ramlibacter terrae]|uniref:Uncharacterized protein n=1 Tax=Ramlibacter terrae TaxID=2732511 RepID=A0ABX6NZH9_9BURK|nr:hypothetical protein HK414_24565 [Ramlibacter terrae]
MDAGRHRVAVVERAAHRAVQLRAGHRGQLVAEDEAGRFGLAAAIQQQPTQRFDAVFAGAGDAGADGGEQHAPRGAQRVGSDVGRAQAGDEARELQFGLHRSTPCAAWRRA